MILGVLIGTYSSIFVASPILKYFKVSYKTIEKEEEKSSLKLIEILSSYH